MLATKPLKLQLEFRFEARHGTNLCLCSLIGRAASLYLVTTDNRLIQVRVLAEAPYNVSLV